MPLYHIRADISQVSCDAIVLAADDRLFIENAELRDQLKKLGGCQIGETKSFACKSLSCRRVILTGTPRNDASLTQSCIAGALHVARKKHFRKIAIHLGTSKNSLEVVTDAVNDFLSQQDMEVYLVSFSDRDRMEYPDLSRQLQHFIAQKTEPQHEKKAFSAFVGAAPAMQQQAMRESISPENLHDLKEALNAEIAQRDESFQQALFRLIDERGMKDSECYRRANVTKATFSKIRSNPDYHPKKQTALAFAVALKLDLTETKQLLTTAGYTLSTSSKLDIIVEFFIRHKIYDIEKINGFLLEYDQVLLGASTA